MFELRKARRRLAAVDIARQLLQDATDVLDGADVKNVRVAKAMAMVRKELTDFHHVTEYSIRKREDRIAYDQSARTQGPTEAQEEVEDPGAGGMSPEEGYLSPGLHGQAEEAQLG